MSKHNTGNLLGNQISPRFIVYEIIHFISKGLIESFYSKRGQSISPVANLPF